MVVIAKGKRALDKIFRELKIEEKIRDVQSVLIKPNLRAAAVNKYARCAITNPEIIKLIAERLLELGKRVVIAEGTSSKYITERALENSGVKKLERNGIEVLNLNLCKIKNIKIENGEVLKEVEVPVPVLESEFIISLPVMKTHSQTMVTLSLKNMMGATGEIMPVRMHLAGIHKAIADINTVIKPDLCIIDATRAMEGSGPVRGREVRLDMLIGGYDPVSVDSVGAKIMGFDPYTIEHIIEAEKRGIGRIDTSVKINAKRFLRPGEDGEKFIDLYSFKLFNLLMCNKFLHSLAYDYLYYFWKRLRG